MEELRGLLAAGVLPEILRRIFLGKRSGILHLACGIDRSDFGFKDGQLTRAVTTVPGAHLGDLLVQIGFLAAQDRDACLEIAALSDERIGETLQRLGLLNGEQLTQGLALQLREVLVRALSGSGGVYTFTDFPKKAGDADRYDEPRLDPREVLLDATWALVSDPVIDALLGDLSRVVRKSRDERLLYLDFRMAEADVSLLGRVDGERTAERLLEESSLAPEEGKASLAGLLAIGAVEYVGAPLATSLSTSVARIEITRLASRLGSADPYEVLGLRPEASSDDIRSTYLRLLRFCDPGSTSEPEFQSVLERMSHQLADAFVEIESRRGLRRAASPYRSDAAAKRTGAPPSEPASVEPLRSADPARTPVNETLTIPSADRSPALDPGRALDASSEAFSAGRHHEALAILHDAIPHLAGRARGAARVRKARVLLAVENGARLAESELKSALAEDPGNADAHEALGAIYHQHGSPALAMMEFRKALELQPRNAAARAGLQQLTGARPDKPQSPRKGFFAR